MIDIRSPNCSGFTSGAGSGSCTIGSLSPSGGVAGISLSGTGSASNFTGSGGFIGIEFLASGSASGSFGPGSFPLHYDFMVTDTAGDVISYALEVDFSTSGGPLDENFSGSTSGGTVSGSPIATVPSNVSVTAYSINFLISDPISPGNSTLSVNIPAGESIDVGGDSSASVPEPGTLSLVASALGGLMWWRRKRS